MTAFQSAYRKYHSTESALLNIHNDILLNMAKGSVTALTLLDLSAIFDKVKQDKYNDFPYLKCLLNQVKNEVFFATANARNVNDMIKMYGKVMDFIKDIM